jgi:hypothetical protein
MHVVPFTTREGAFAAATVLFDYAETFPDDPEVSAIITRALTQVEDVATARPLGPRERADHAAWSLDEILATYEGDSDIARILSPAIWALVELAKRRSPRGVSVYEREAQRHA